MKEYFDKYGNVVKVGDTIAGEGHLYCNGNFKIDLSSVVTANIRNGKMYFGWLSAESFYQEEYDKQISKKSARFRIIQEQEKDESYRK